MPLVAAPLTAEATEVMRESVAPLIAFTALEAVSNPGNPLNGLLFSERGVPAGETARDCAILRS